MVKYGQIGGVSDAAVFIADAKGFFKAQGIAHEPRAFNSAEQVIAPLGAGELAVGTGAPSADLFNAVDRGAKLRIVADNGSLLLGHGYEAIIVRRDLAGRVKSAKDMKGLKVSIAARDIVLEYSLDRFLRTGGLTIKDVEVVPLTFPNMITALAGGSIDVAALIEPYVTRILQAETGVLITRTDAVVPNAQTAVILYSETFAQQRNIAACWMLAYIQGARFFNDAFDKNDPAKRKEAIEILSKATKLEAALFGNMVLPGLHPDGKVNVESLGAAQEYFVAKRSQLKVADLAKLVDLSFAEEAVKQLGPYR